MTIGAVLKKKGSDTITLPAETVVADAVVLLTKRRIGAIPVMRGSTIVGVFSERDVIHGLRDNGAAALDQQIADLMTKPAVTVTMADTVLGALALMTERRIRHLPVLENGDLVGVVSIGDLVKYRIELIESEALVLRDYIQSA